MRDASNFNSEIDIYSILVQITGIGSPQPFILCSTPLSVERNSCSSPYQVSFQTKYSQTWNPTKDLDKESSFRIWLSVQNPPPLKYNTPSHKKKIVSLNIQA